MTGIVGYTGSLKTIIDGKLAASAVTAASAADVPVSDSATLTGATVPAALDALAARIAVLESGTASAPTPLTNSAVPAVTGTTGLGDTLTASTGTWSATPDSYTRQWKRDGTSISAATGTSYVITAADQGHTLTVTVTATKAGYTSAAATSTGTTIPAAASGGGTTFAITDTFTRADSTPLGTTETGGKAWNDPDGVYKIASGVAYNAFGFGTGAVLDIGGIDQTVEFTAVDGASVQAYLRYTDGSNWLLIQGDGTILRSVGGSQAVDSTNGPTWANGDTVRVKLAGTAATLSINGSQVKTWTTGVTTGQKFVMHNGHFDNIKANTP